jgi:CPA1 family monovalent cation:H+ antiporter
MNDTHFTITVFIVLLLIASGVAMATKWLPVPYTIALVIVGIVISPMHFLPAVHISPDLILLIFLPALIFEAAWSLKFARVRANFLPILFLAIVGIGLSVLITGSIVHLTSGLSWGSSLLFGAIISPTDPISVLALFKRLGVPERLRVLVEGESLFNDGTAVVFFTIILNIVTGVSQFNSTHALVAHFHCSFALVVLGGTVLGLAIGFYASHLTSHFDDHLLEISLTTIAAYGSFIVAERVHVSPVIAVLVTGLVLGDYGRRKGMSKNTQLAVDSFWEYAAFVVNSLVFLLIGLEIQISLLASYLLLILFAVAAMIAARLIVTYGTFVFVNRFVDSVPWRWQHVIFWGGLRGAVSIALALSLPANFPDRVQLVAMTFGAVTFSLLVQGLTLSSLLKFLRLGGLRNRLERERLA